MVAKSRFIAHQLCVVPHHMCDVTPILYGFCPPCYVCRTLWPLYTMWFLSSPLRVIWSPYTIWFLSFLLSVSHVICVSWPLYNFCATCVTRHIWDIAFVLRVSCIIRVTWLLCGLCLLATCVARMFATHHMIFVLPTTCVARHTCDVALMWFSVLRESYVIWVTLVLCYICRTSYVWHGPM